MEAATRLELNMTKERCAAAFGVPDRIEGYRTGWERISLSGSIHCGKQDRQVSTFGF